MQDNNIKIGDKFGQNDRYEILSILGEGGMGIVLKAYDSILKEYVAIKTLHSKLASDDSVKNRFLNEAKLCLALTHSNIIRVRDVSIYNNIYYMVMQYIQGVELKSILKDQDTNNLKSIYTLIRPILQALKYAHTYTIHRDIKPANIMISSNTAYLMDFGISKALENSDIENHTVIGGMGTKKYASPEQTFNANDVDKRTDIYSMGILLYEMFTKTVPKNTAIEEPKKPSFYNKNISYTLDNVILKMIDSKTNMRQDDFSEVITNLDDIFFEDTKDITKQVMEKRIIKNINTNMNDIENMVLIPSGNFLRGSGIESKIQIEKPRKSIYLDEFYISKYCVTNKEFAEFIEKTNYKKPKNFDENFKNKPDHPVVYVSYDDTMEYCKFNNCDLPSEAQWEKVAKDANNLTYPWGNDFDVKKTNTFHAHETTVNVYDYDNAKTSNEIYNLAGNVWEWCKDDFIENFYSSDQKENPIAINNGNVKVIRGGSFDFASIAARSSFRFNSNKNIQENNIGFRVVKNVN